MPIVLGISLAFLLLGLVPLGGLVLRGYRSTHWPMASGTIIVSRVHVEFSASDEPSFCPTLEYRFSIMGRKYVGNRIRALTWSHTSHESASKALSDYPVGKAVTVRHHPSRPEDSVLEPGLRHRDIVLSVIYVAVCIYLAAELTSQLGFPVL